MEIALTPRFRRHVRKRLTDDERRGLARALRLFASNPTDPRLGTHKLSGPLAECWAFQFGYDARVVFEWRGDIAVLLDVGSHDEVYG